MMLHISLLIFFSEVFVQIFCLFFNCVCCCCCTLRILCIFGYQFFIRYGYYKYFLPICGLSFHTLDSGFVKQKFLILK